MKKAEARAFAFLGIAAFLLAGGVAAAGPMYDWNKGDVQKFTDPAGDTKNYGAPYLSCLDIVAAYHAFDGTHHYFRIDLASAPGISEIPERLRKAYYDLRFGIFINADPGGAREDNYYVAEIPGVQRRENRIDCILDARLGPMTAGYRTWNGTDFTRGRDIAFRQDGATLEWKWKGDLPPAFAWYAAVMIPGRGPHKKTIDFVESQLPVLRRSSVPVPSPSPTPMKPANTVR